MCRWFTYISQNEPCLLDDILVTPANSICHQVREHYLPKLIPWDPNKPPSPRDKQVWARNSVLNVDGCGVAWYNDAAASFMPGCTGLRPALYKSVSTPINDFNFLSLCRNTESKAVFAHVRAATSIVQQSNCHPFVFGRHTFMHNGIIDSFDDIRRDMTLLLDHDAFLNVLGSTDSEHLAALYITLLTDGKGESSWQEEYPVQDMAKALTDAVRKVLQLQRGLSDRKANSLNLAVTDGRKLVALRFRNNHTEEPPSLYYSTTAGRTLNRKYPGHPDGDDKENVHAFKHENEHGKHVIVSSEPTTFKEKEWNLIKKNSCLTVTEECDVHIEPMEYDEEDNVDDDITDEDDNNGGDVMVKSYVIV